MTATERAIAEAHAIARAVQAAGGSATPEEIARRTGLDLGRVKRRLQSNGASMSRLDWRLFVPREDGRYGLTAVGLAAVTTMRDAA